MKHTHSIKVTRKKEKKDKKKKINDIWVHVFNIGTVSYE